MQFMQLVHAIHANKTDRLEERTLIFSNELSNLFESYGSMITCSRMIQINSNIHKCP